MKVLPFCLIFLFAIDVTAQKTDSTRTTIESADGEEIFVTVDTPSMPAGGYEVFYQYIGSNLQYPKEARVSNITGKVIIEFVVEKDGSISKKNIKVLKSPHRSLSDEAVRLIKNAPKWIPGKDKNVPVRTKKVLPITFRLG